MFDIWHYSDLDTTAIPETSQPGHMTCGVPLATQTLEKAAQPGDRYHPRTPDVEGRVDVPVISLALQETTPCTP